jgi:hypothetical protein
LSSQAITKVFTMVRVTHDHSRRWLLAALLFVLFRAIPNISYPMGRDAATFVVMGEDLLRGLRLYRDLWDNKPPGIFAVYAVLVKPLGHVMWSLGLIDILWLLAISYCVFRFTKHYLEPAAGAIAVVVNAAWHCSFGYTDAVQPECFLMLLVFAGYFLVAAEGRWQPARDLLAGICLGGAFWLKYNALGFLPFLALFPYIDWRGFDLRPRRLRLLVPWRAWLARVAVLLAGLLMALVAVIGYFHFTGSWAAFREVQLEVLPRYGMMAPKLIPRFWVIETARALYWVGGWTWVATGAAFLLAEDGDLSRLLPILAPTALGYAVTVSQLRFFPYTFETCFPFFAAIWGYLGLKAYEGLKQSTPGSRRRWMTRLLVGGALTVIVVGPVRKEAVAIAWRYRDLIWWRRAPRDFFAHYPAIRWPNENLDGQLQVVGALDRLSSPKDGLFVWGTAPLIYFLTGLRPPTRFISNIPLIARWGPPEWRDELVRDLKKSPPEFLVVAQDDKIPDIVLNDLNSDEHLSHYPELAGLISASYNFMAEFPHYLVYRHKPPGSK